MIGIVPELNREKRVLVGLPTSVHVFVASNKDEVSVTKARVKESQVSVL